MYNMKDFFAYYHNIEDYRKQHPNSIFLLNKKSPITDKHILMAELRGNCKVFEYNNKILFIAQMDPATGQLITK